MNLKQMSEGIARLMAKLPPDCKAYQELKDIKEKADARQAAKRKLPSEAA